MEPAKEALSLIPRATFSQVVNHPLTWAFIIITLAGGSSFYLYTQAHRETVHNLEIQNQNCEEEIKAEKLRAEEYLNQRDTLYNRYLFDPNFKKK